MNLRHFHQATEEARLMGWDWWTLDRAPIASATGIRRLLDYARGYGLVLNQAHFRIAERFGVSTDGVTFTPPYVWEHSSDATPRPDHFRGFDPNRDMPHDPDGLDDIDPFVLGLTAGRSAKTLLILATSAYHAPPDSWIRDLYEHRSVVTEIPPFQMMAEAPQVEKVRAAIRAVEQMPIPAGTIMLIDEAGGWPERWNAADASPLEELKSLRRLFDDPIEDVRMTYRLQATHYADAFDKLTVIEPAPTGKRYGPYDADPHTKGRRRRFRTQRKA